MKEFIVLRWAAIFLVIAIIAGVFGFGNLAATASGIARVLFFIFIVLLLVAVISGAMRGW